MASYFPYRDGDEPVPQYFLVEQLAKGGFGEVWKARRPGGFFEALKIIDVSGQHGLKEFASLDVVKNFRHANLVSIHGCWLKDESGTIMADSVFEAMSRELESASVSLSGRTQVATARPVELLISMDLGLMSLHALLEEHKRIGLPGIPPDELLEYMRDSAKAIDYLNSRKPPIVHGDIKPHNILLVGNSAQLCDFGLCTAVQNIRHTQPTPVTVAYAAPELFSGKPTAKSDQYSLAVTYVELRTGRLPFDDDTLSYPYQVMDAHKRGLLKLDALSPEAKKVIRKATSPNPEDRWASTSKMVRALADAECVGSFDSNDLRTSRRFPPIAPAPNQGASPDSQRNTPRDSTVETEQFPGAGGGQQNKIGQTIGPPSQSSVMPPPAPAIIPAPPIIPTPTDSAKRSRQDKPHSIKPAPTEQGRLRRRRIAAILLAAGTLAGVALLAYFMLPHPRRDDRGSLNEVKSLIDQDKFVEAIKELKRLEQDLINSITSRDNDQKDPSNASIPAIGPADVAVMRKQCIDKWRKYAQTHDLQSIDPDRDPNPLKSINDYRDDLGVQNASELQVLFLKTWLAARAGNPGDWETTQPLKFIEDHRQFINKKTADTYQDRFLDVWLEQNDNLANWKNADPFLFLESQHQSKRVTDEQAKRRTQQLLSAWEKRVDEALLRQPAPDVAEITTLVKNAVPTIASVKGGKLKELRDVAIDRWKKENLTVASTVQVALDALKSAPEIATTDDVRTLKEYVVTEWTKAARTNVQTIDKTAAESTPKASRIKDICTRLLDFIRSEKELRFTHDAVGELYLLRARGFVVLGFESKKDQDGTTVESERAPIRVAARNDLASAKAEFAQAAADVKPGGPGPRHFELLETATELLAAEPVEGDKSIRDNLDEQFKTYHDLYPKTTESDLRPSIWELTKLKDREKRPIYKPQPTPTVATLKDVQKLVENRRFPDARAKLLEVDRTDVDDDYFATLINLLDRDTAIDDTKQSLDNLNALVPRLYGTSQPSPLEDQAINLVNALKVSADRDPENFLSPAINEIRILRKNPQNDAKLVAALKALNANLAENRIVRTFQQSMNAEPTPAQRDRVIEDYKDLAAHPAPGVEEFWLECQTLRNPIHPADFAGAPARAAARTPEYQYYFYAQFVAASAARWALDRKTDEVQLWNDKILNPLDAAFDPKRNECPELDRVQFRKDRAAELLVAGVRHCFPRKSISVAAGQTLTADEFQQTLDQPFVSSTDAQKAFDHLLKAAKLSPNSPNIATPKFQVDLALASWYSPARDLTSPSTWTPIKLLLIADGRLLPDDTIAKKIGDDDSAAVLFAEFENCRKANLPAAILFGRALARLCHNWWPDRDPLANVIYEKVLAPAEAMADGQLRSRAKPADLHEFYGDASQFVESYRYLKLKGSQPRFEKIEQLLNHAIEDLGKKDIPAYLIRRGLARSDLLRPKPDLDGALKDADAALDVLKRGGFGIDAGMNKNADLVKALGLKGTSLLLAARQERCYPTRLKYREKAIVDALQPVNTDAKLVGFATTEDRADHWILESMAHLEQGNDLTDSREKEELHAAVSAAKTALDLPDQNYPEFAYEALGNACEDLADLVREDPEKNFKAACDAFDAAIRKNPAADSFLLDRGRCYKKWFDRGNDAQIAKNADDDLRTVIQEGDPADATQAHWFLGQLYQRQQKFKEADGEFEAAIKSARAANDPEIALYIQYWANAPLVEYGFKNAGAQKPTADERKSLVDTARSRAADLKAAPRPMQASIDPKLDGAIVVANSYTLEGKPEEALKTLDNVPPIAIDEPGCELTPPQRNVLIARMDFRNDELGKRWSNRDLKTFLDDVKMLLDDAKKLEDSKMVSETYRAETYAKCARARVNLIYLTPAEQLQLGLDKAYVPQQVEAALGDYERTISIYDNLKPGKTAAYYRSQHFAFALGWLVFRDKYKVDQPAGLTKAMTNALSHAKELKNYYERNGYPGKPFPEPVDLEKYIKRLGG